MNSESRIGSSIWTCLFLVGLACTIRDVYTVTCQYLDYPVTTAMTIDQEASLSFPAITICNLNRVHCGNLRRVAFQEKNSTEAVHLHALLEMTECSSSRQKRHLSLSEAVPILPTVATPANSSDASNIGVRGRKTVNQTRTFNDLMDFMTVYTNLSLELRNKMGHNFNQLIRTCTYSGQSCLNLTKFFKKSLSNSFGNCYTFSTPRRAVIPGGDYGLSLELYLDQENYSKGGLTPRAGARVIVHSKDRRPLPDENGLTVAPHTATSIALLEVRLLSQPLPYVTNCSDSWERTWYNDYVNSAFPYSLEACHRVCIQKAFEERCSCGHPSYMDIPTGMIPCNLTSTSPAYQCSNLVLEDFENRRRLCSCNMDCRDVTYETRISTAAWPTDNHWCSIALKDHVSSYCDEDNEETKRSAQNNLVRVDVYLENLKVKTIAQYPTYQVQTLIGSLGGALSLYLGITLLMLIECLELVFHFCTNLWKQYFNRTWSSKRRGRKRFHLNGGIPAQATFERKTKFAWQ